MYTESGFVADLGIKSPAHLISRNHLVSFNYRWCGYTGIPSSPVWLHYARLMNPVHYKTLDRCVSGVHQNHGKIFTCDQLFMFLVKYAHLYSFRGFLQTLAGNSKSKSSHRSPKFIDYPVFSIVKSSVCLPLIILRRLLCKLIQRCSSHPGTSRYKVQGAVRIRILERSQRRYTNRILFSCGKPWKSNER